MPLKNVSALGYRKPLPMLLTKSSLLSFRSSMRFPKVPTCRIAGTFQFGALWPWKKRWLLYDALRAQPPPNFVQRLGHSDTDHLFLERVEPFEEVYQPQDVKIVTNGLWTYLLQPAGPRSLALSTETLQYAILELRRQIT